MQLKAAAKSQNINPFFICMLVFILCLLNTVSVCRSQTYYFPKKTADQKDPFRAGVTPGQTFMRYLEANRQYVTDPNLDIYTDKSKQLFRKRVVTKAQMDDSRKFEGIPFQLKTQGSYAVIYYPDRDLHYNPFYFKKSVQGWQLDFVTMNKTIRFNHQNEWLFSSTNHPYMFAFKGYPINKNGFVYFKGR